jgi:hypothetical protein
MIPEIGLMVGMYILARLVPAQWSRLSKLIGVIASVVAVACVADLTARGVTGNGLSAQFHRDVPQNSAAVVTDKTPSINAQKVMTTTVSRTDGGSIRTELGFGIAVAKGSSLQREFVFVHDSALPVVVTGTPGVTTIYKRDGYRGEYRYSVNVELKTTKALRAIQVKFLTFDVWGEHVRTLSSEDVTDVPADTVKKMSSEWQLFSENDVEKHYATIGWVSRVRLDDGRIVVADEAPIVAEAMKFSSKFKAEDLEPKPPSKSAD